MSNEMKPSGSLVYRLIKRVFDVMVSAILIIPIGIVIIISALFIKVEDKGPVFYMADRTGQRTRHSVGRWFDLQWRR